MKLDTNGVMTLKNINLLNNDFLCKITTLEQEVNVSQQTLGTATQDIGGLQQQIDVINEELNRKTHFRGYYLLNTDIQQLENSANGDFAFSAESGTVWMYDNSWYNSGDIVPDQVTPASDAKTLVDSGTGVAGTSTQYSRGDHQHPLQVSDVLPSKDTSVGTIGSASTYARSDHQHPIQTVDTIPVSDSADGSYGTVESYARNDHSHPINVQTNASIVPIVNRVGNNGTSAYYSRHDHVHPQQLTYDGNVTATKFIKSGGTNQQILLADGSTTPLVLAQKQYYVAGTTTYIKLCTFNAYIQPSSTSVEFTINCRSGFGLIQFNQSYSSNGLSAYQYKPQINFDYGMQACYIVYFGTDADKYGELQAKLDAWSNSLIIKQTNQSQDTVPLANVLNTDATGALPTGYSSMFTLYPNTYNTPFQINPSTTGHSQGIRLSRNYGGCGIYLGVDPNQASGMIDNQWSINTPYSDYGQNPLGLTIALTSEQYTANRGLRISADGNTLSFNGSVIAGTGTTGSDSNGSVNYSAGNPILWGVNSVGTEGGFYSDGAKVYWRAKPVTLGSVPP
ncbi:MAG: hypothetical protein EZS28_019801 [Streblomastix strix]|uniref:Uncharacterized protein n=1 Tax=Streblomastix strix TaxID=222440 RepID=A0A5J4VQ00_9EUKA|nr:MAG: hypothetical protein EZS28_019801 [Streblomastix strix]